MITLVNYASENMTRAQQECSQSSLKYGVDNVVEYKGQKDLSEWFRCFNGDVLGQSRGDGYWLWKPYIIYEQISKMNDGDILIYSDSGVKFIRDVRLIIDAMDQDIFLFSNGHQHVHWCKADVLGAILLGEFGYSFDGPEEFQSHQQVQASVIFFKVNDTTRNFVKEWLLWAQMPGFIDDSPSKQPNHPEFAEHRHDQAILTCLQIKYGYRLHWWADGHWYESQRFRWPEDKYPAVLWHHRMRNEDYK